MAEPSEAITASETYRALGQGQSADTTNDYIRNTIIIQGTGRYDNPYAAIQAMPLHCNIIGLGDWPCGLGEGMVVIGDWESADDAISNEDNTGDITRGCNLYNLHVSSYAGTGYSAMKVVYMYRSRIEDCWFGQNVAGGAVPINAGIECTGSFSGNLVRHCIIGQRNGSSAPNIGMDMVFSGSGANNLIEDNIIFGTVTGILCTAGTNWEGSVIRNNTIGGILAQCTSYGIVAGTGVLIVNNYITAADPINSAAAGEMIGNIIVDDGTGGTLTEYARS